MYFFLTGGLLRIVFIVDDNSFKLLNCKIVSSLSTGYNVILTYPNFETEETTVTESGIKFDNQSTVGIFNVSVNALGNRGADGGNAYFDSQYTSSGIFVVYEDLLEFPQSFLQGLTILR